MAVAKSESNRSEPQRRGNDRGTSKDASLHAAAAQAVITWYSSDETSVGVGQRSKRDLPVGFEAEQALATLGREMGLAARAGSTDNQDNNHLREEDEGSRRVNRGVEQGVRLYRR